MSNATHTPPDAPPSTPAEVLPSEDDELTGVRKVPVHAEEGGRPAVHWGAIFAGLLLSTGGQILLWLLGFAVGFTIMARPGNRMAMGFGAGSAIWVALVLLATLFAGGYAAARLAGAVRRSGGMLAGGLVWALSAVAAVWLLGSSAMMAMPVVPRIHAPPIQAFAAGVAGPGDFAAGVAGPGEFAAGPAGPGQMGESFDSRPASEGRAFAGQPQPFPPPPRVTPADLSRAAWGAFAYAAIALLGALAGGARGAAASGVKSTAA